MILSEDRIEATLSSQFHHILKVHHYKVKTLHHNPKPNGLPNGRAGPPQLVSPIWKPGNSNGGEAENPAAFVSGLTLPSWNFSVVGLDYNAGVR